MKYNFFSSYRSALLQDVFAFIFYSIVKVRCDNELVKQAEFFFLSKIEFQELKTRSTLPGQSVSQNLVSGGDKENGSDQMVQKMHSCALLVPPPLLVQSRHCEAFEARCTSHPQSSPNSLSKARIKGFIYERKLNDKDNIFHSFKSELLFLAPRKGLKKSSSN